MIISNTRDVECQSAASSSVSCDRCLETLGKTSDKLAGNAVIYKSKLISVQKQVIILFVMISVVGIYCVSMHVLSRNGVNRPYISLKVDRSRIPKCKEATNPIYLRLGYLFAELPCVNQNRLVLTAKDKSLGPLTCADRDQVACNQGWFPLTPEADGVVISENGVYRVHSQVTFLERNRETRFLTSTVRLDTRGSVGSDGDAGIWLDCASHSPHANSTDPFGVCSLNGVRYLRRGDIISFQVRNQYRLINPAGSATRFFLYKL